MPTGHLTRDVLALVEPTPEIQQILLDVYRRDAKSAEICERLVDLDEGIAEWRYRHVRMVERTIGSKPEQAAHVEPPICNRRSGEICFPICGRSARGSVS